MIVKMFEELCWFALWVVLLIGVHYQFKVCIPVTVWCLKVIESFALLLLIKLYFFLSIYQNDFHAVKTMVGNATVNALKETLKKFSTDL